jgi:hypothetical protein
MVRLDTSLSFSRVPYITYEALDDYAEKLIREAAPESLLTPVPIDAERFAEFYLGMQIDVRRLSYDRQILGMTAFNSGVIQVCDEISGEPQPLLAAEGTLFIDPSLMSRRNAARRRFTCMHECSHWILHREAFSADNPFGSPGVYGNQYLAAKEGRIDYSRSQKERNDSERIERQADFFASALLMPRPPLRIAYREFFSYYNDIPCQIVRGSSATDDNYAQLLPPFIADRFGVSKRAALIRLEKLKAIVDKSKFRVNQNELI